MNKRFEAFREYVIGVINDRITSTSNIFIGFRNRLNSIEGQVRGVQSKFDTHIASLVPDQTENLKNEIQQMKKVLIAHAERIDAMARFNKIDYVDQVETKIIKEYRKIK